MSLNMSGNVCGAEAGSALARMLMANTVLTAVELADNSFSNTAAAVFAEMLSVNTTLLSLDLSGNLITAEPCKALCRAVRGQAVAHGKPCNTELVLLRNDISPDQQMDVTNILGKDWKYKKTTAGISCRLRKMPSADKALAALTSKQHAMLESAFFAFDEDGSGEMDANELFQASEQMGLQMKAEEVEDMIKVLDTDGSGTIDMEEFKSAMAVIIAINKAEEDDDSEDEVEDVQTEEEMITALMLASGVYDPCHVFPEAMKTDERAVQQGSYAALRTGYRILCHVERNASLSDKHQQVVRRVLTFLGWDKSMLKRKMPFTARQLRTALSAVSSITDAPTAVPGSTEEKLEKRLAAVETPEDDVSRLDQAILWLFRGVPLTMDEIEREKD